MILAETTRSAPQALDKLLPFQRSDFEGIFEAMDGLPVTIRLLDPPLHEFLPDTRSCERDRRAALPGRSPARSPRSRRSWQRSAAARGQPDARPPRLPPGHHLSRRSTRCRCGRSSRPPCTSAKDRRCTRMSEIMIPLVGLVKELQLTATAVRGRGQEVMEGDRRAARATRSAR